MTRLLYLLLALAVPLATHAAQPTTKPRARDLGIPFDGTRGRWNAITDVSGVAVGYATLIRDEGAQLNTHYRSFQAPMGLPNRPIYYLRVQRLEKAQPAGKEQAALALMRRVLTELDRLNSLRAEVTARTRADRSEAVARSLIDDSPSGSRVAASVSSEMLSEPPLRGSAARDSPPASRSSAIGRSTSRDQ